jgi:serine protease
MDCSGTGTASAIIAGVDWVTKNRVLPAVANMSLGTPFYSTLNAAVQNSIKAGIVYVVAAGNSNADACTVSPASTPEAITVAASGNSDAKSSFSNYGKCVDIFAPGEAIESAWVTSDTSSMILGGTSMAAPHVAGVAALYLSANPTASPAEVSAAVMNGGTSGVLSGVPSGTPNLLVYSVLASATLPPPPPPPPPPVDTGTVIAPLTVDQPPTAAFAFNCAKAKCIFDASGSRDDIGIVSYGWNFGDGSATVSASTVAKLSHTYSKPGSFTVTLQVTDTAGHSSSKAVTVVVKKV